MNETMLAGMREALSRLQQDGPLAATQTIAQTLRDLMSTATWDATPAAPPDGAAEQTRDAAPTPPPELAEERNATTPGRFLAGSFTNHAGTRAYKLYVPSAHRDAPLPLLIMLHGCAQDPDAVAAGTRLNLLAEAQPCLVLYPAQAQSANATRCWNWFSARNQQRDQGEPAIIAGLTREMIATYRVDPTRVYCAGVSAGGAMAAIMGATYPDLYAALGIHSGLPYAAATNVAAALAAMQGSGAGPAAVDHQGLPIIVFHGDRDEQIHPRNGDHLIAQFVAGTTTTHVNRGQAEGGRAYTQTMYRGPDGKVVAEHWLLHGTGHAWSGGHHGGSFTDGQGPDATREMMRFFAAQSQSAAP